MLSEGNLHWYSGSHPAYEALELCTLHGPRCFGVCKLPDDKLGCPVLLPKFREQILQCCPQVCQQGIAHLREEHMGLNGHWAMGIYLPLLPIFKNAIGLIYVQLQYILKILLMKFFNAYAFYRQCCNMSTKSVWLYYCYLSNPHSFSYLSVAFLLKIVLACSWLYVL